MGKIASQITSLTIVYSTVYSDTDQGKHQSSASLAFVRGIYAENVSIWWRHHVRARFLEVVHSLTYIPPKSKTIFGPYQNAKHVMKMT